MNNGRDRWWYSNDLGCILAFFDYIIFEQLIDSSLSSPRDYQGWWSIPACFFGWLRLFYFIWNVLGGLSCESEWAAFLKKIELHNPNILTILYYSIPCLWYIMYNESFPSNRPILELIWINIFSWALKNRLNACLCM